MTKTRAVREVLILTVTVLALYNAGRAISDSIERQVFLHKQTAMLKTGQEQAAEVNKSYRSSTGIERLARERLNLAGPDEVVVRLGK
jgi:cell division protein FtsB